MNWQKFIGFNLTTMSSYAISHFSGDWKLSFLGIIAGLGGLIYGDAK